MLLGLPAVLTTRCLAQMTIAEDADRGTLAIRDKKSDVLTYCYGDQLKTGVPAAYTRSSYIHPLYSLDGKVLTDDFPIDHLHHRGVSWTWPIVKTRGQDTQTWSPAVPSLRQNFVRWLKREASKGTALVQVENAWKLAEKEVVAKEIVSICVHEADGAGRAVDLEIELEAVGGPLELRGTPEGGKGYGGLCFRSSPLLKGAAMTTDQGSQKEDVVNTRFRWADISTKDTGIAIFVSPDHPDFPTNWLIRNSYAGVLNPSWPGLKSAVIRPGEPVRLLYRIYVHRGNAESGKAAEAYERYLKDAIAAASQVQKLVQR
jgi:hypothetical protein